jgi:uncharacterized protein YjiS (DUF1127 family)
MITSNLEAQLNVRRTPEGKLVALAGAIMNRVAAVRRAIQNRRSVKQLLEWDARMLQDIGLTRGDVVAAMSGPINEDPAHRLSVLSVERRAAYRATAHERLSAAARTADFPRWKPAAERVKVLEI